MHHRNYLNLVVFAFVFILYSCTKDVAENKVPVADAGPSKNVILPFESEPLNGSGADSDGNVVSYLWSQVKGPYETTIITPGSASTAVKGLGEGTYVFQLMVTDN